MTTITKAVMVDFTKDFGYGLLGNNVIGGVVSYADQIFGDMIMKCKYCEQVHSTKKISVKKYADMVMNYYYFTSISVKTVTVFNQ